MGENPFATADRDGVRVPAATLAAAVELLRRALASGDADPAIIRDALAAAPVRDDGADGPVLRDVSTVPEERIEWLWPGRLPLRALTLLAGPPGVSKSTLALDLAARVTTGLPWPDEMPALPWRNNGDSVATPVRAPGDVVLVTLEDHLASVVRPRLRVAGADFARRIVAVEAIRESGRDRLFSLVDLSAIHAALDRCPRPLVVVLDPVSAMMPGTDTHNNSQVREGLAPLAALAAERRVAVLAITHLRKNSAGGNALAAIMGSVAFTAAARAAFLVIRDPDDRSRRLMLPGKANLAGDRFGLAYRVEVIDDVPRLAWEPDPVDLDPDQIMAQIESPRRDAPAIRDASAWLESLLAAHPEGLLVSEIKRAAKQDGHSWRTVERAKGGLPTVSAAKQSFSGGWAWRLEGRQP